jgi:hypothetical protein
VELVPVEEEEPPPNPVLRSITSPSSGGCNGSPLLADAARFARHSPGDPWFANETYVNVNGLSHRAALVSGGRIFTAFDQESGE